MARDGAPGRLAMPRRRGAVSGLLITIGGIWCAAIPFVGHYFNFVVGPDKAWDMTTGRFWLSLLPGVVAAVGGLMLMRSANRASATLGAQLALAAGLWLVMGRELSQLWSSSWAEPPVGGRTRGALELLLYFYGTGAAITALAGVALGRVSSRHAGDVERLTAAHDRERARAAAAETPEPEGQPVDERAHTGRFSRRARTVDDEPVGGSVADDAPATRTGRTRRHSRGLQRGPRSRFRGPCAIPVTSSSRSRSTPLSRCGRSRSSRRG
jgi:hypothetical protein